MINCPLLCGECDKPFPSDAPSPTPTIYVYPSVKVAVETTFDLVSLKAPEDPLELEAFEAKLIEAFQTYVPDNSIVVAVILSYRSRQVYDTATFATKQIFSCTTDTCEDQEANSSDFVEENGWCFTFCNTDRRTK